MIPGLGISLRDGNSTPLQYSCLKNLMDRGSWGLPVHGLPVHLEHNLVQDLPLFLRIPWEGCRCLYILIAHLLPVVPKCYFRLPGHLWQLHLHWVSLLFQPIPGGFTLSVDTVLSFQHEHRAEIKQVTN